MYLQLFFNMCITLSYIIVDIVANQRSTYESVEKSTKNQANHEPDFPDIERDFLQVGV